MQPRFQQFSSTVPPPAKPTDTEDAQKLVVGDYEFSDADIKGTRRAQEGLLLMAYTCGKCEHKQARTFSKSSYLKGVVLIRCENCDSLHLVADNLGWFEDSKVNIQIIMERQGKHITTNVTSSAIEIDQIPNEDATDQ